VTWTGGLVDVWVVELDGWISRMVGGMVLEYTNGWVVGWIRG
jgi:hypothetical protein